MAAEAFGLTTYDAFRKPRRSTTTSHLDETLELVAEAMVAQRPATGEGRPAGDRSGGDGPGRRRAAVVVLCVLVAAGIAAVLVARGSDGAERRRSSSAQPTAARLSSLPVTTRCPAKVGDLPAAAPPEVSRFVAPFHAAVATSHPQPCAAAPIGRWQNLIFQPLQNASGHPDGV